MKFSENFKRVWAIFLAVILGLYLWARYESIMAGASAPVDVFVFLIFMALLLSPLMSEIEFFGIIKLKREIEDLKNKIDIKFGDLKNEIKLTQSQSITQHFAQPAPLPESELKKLSAVTENIFSSFTWWLKKVAPMETSKNRQIHKWQHHRIMWISLLRVLTWRKK